MPMNRYAENREREADKKQAVFVSQATAEPLETRAFQLLKEGGTGRKRRLEVQHESYNAMNFSEVARVFKDVLG